MNPDSEKPIDKNLENLIQFDGDTGEFEKLRLQLADTEKKYYDLKARFRGAHRRIQQRVYPTGSHFRGFTHGRSHCGPEPGDSFQADCRR